MKAPPIRLTKSQRSRLYEQGIGTGIIAWKVSDNMITEIEFFADQDGDIRHLKDGSKIFPLEVHFS